MKAVVKKWGNSAGVRLPVSIMKEASLSINQELDVKAEKGVVIIRPIKSNRDSLAEMVAKITPENIHAEVDFGSSVGNEIEL